MKLIFRTDKTRSENNHNFIPVQNKIVICILHTRQNNLIRKVVFIFSTMEMKESKFSILLFCPFFKLHSVNFIGQLRHSSACVSLTKKLETNNKIENIYPLPHPVARMEASLYKKAEMRRAVHQNCCQRRGQISERNVYQNLLG